MVKLIPPFPPFQTSTTTPEPPLGTGSFIGSCGLVSAPLCIPTTHAHLFPFSRPTASAAVNTASQASDTSDALQRHNARALADDLLETNAPAIGASQTTSAPSAVIPNPGAATTGGSGPIPAGWEQRFTPEGRPYFVE